MSLKYSIPIFIMVFLMQASLLTAESLRPIQNKEPNSIEESSSLLEPLWPNEELDNGGGGCFYTRNGNPIISQDKHELIRVKVDGNVYDLDHLTTIQTTGADRYIYSNPTAGLSVEFVEVVPVKGKWGTSIGTLKVKFKDKTEVITCQIDCGS